VLISFCTRIYLALKGFKNNVRSLPGDLALLPQEAVAGTEVGREQFAALLHGVSALFAQGLIQEELDAAAGTVAQLEVDHSVMMHFVIQQRGEVCGLSVFAERRPQQRLRVLFATEAEIAREIQGALSAFHLPQNRVLH